jgi:hypothetical protein
MKKTMLFILSSFLALSTSSLGLAQSGTLSNPTSKVFRSCDLVNRQGLITISTKYQVLIEFPAQIEEMSANHGEIMKISPDKPELIKNRLYIDAVKTAGVSDLIVIVDGDSLLFRLVADNTSFNGIRKYGVNACNTAPVASSSTASTSMAGSIRNPAWLTFDTQPKMDAKGNASINYTLRNNGKNPVYAVPSSLELWGKQDGITNLLKVEVQTDSANVLASKSVQMGVIQASNVNTYSDLVLRWSIRDAASNRDYVLEKPILMQDKASLPAGAVNVLAFYGLDSVL